MRIAIFMLVPCFTACSGKTVTVGALQPVMVLPAIPNPDVDLLFVIDNSPSMADKQASLVASFPDMMDALDSLPGGMPNVHIGVVTSDMGTQGSQDAESGPTIGNPPNHGGCGGVGDDGQLQHNSMALAGSFITDVGNSDGTRTRNYTGELRDVFTQIASVGEGGCGFEQHLAAMRRAVQNPANADFVRPTANLAVIVLADEDDCSMSHNAMIDPSGVTAAALGPLMSFRCTRFGVECDDGGVTTDDMNTIGTKDRCHSRANSQYVEDPDSFVDFLDSVKPDPRMVMFAAIAGDRTPVEVELRSAGNGAPAIPALAHSCTYPTPGNQLELADPAVRLGQVVDAFPGRGTFETVCNNDLTVSLSDVGYAAKQLIGDPCLGTAIADASPAPGLQPVCSVTDDDATIPACDGTNLDGCWQFVVDPATCPAAPGNLRFEVVRAAAPTTQSFIEVRCLLAR